MPDIFGQLIAEFVFEFIVNRPFIHTPTHTRARILPGTNKVFHFPTFQLAFRFANDKWPSKILSIIR